MSDTSHNTAALQQSLTDTGPDPAGLFDLVVRHYADPGAVEVLRKHAEGSFPSLVTVYAALKQIELLQTKELLKLNHTEQAKLKHMEPSDARKAYLALHGQVDSSAGAMFAHATEADLLESFRTVCSGLPDGGLDWTVMVSYFFAEYAPLDALTARVTAEMPWKSMMGCSPELGAGPPNSAAEPSRDPDAVGDRIAWLVSRYLYNRFGDHAQSWEGFGHVYPSEIVGVAADIAAAAVHA